MVQPQFYEATRILFVRKKIAKHACVVNACWSLTFAHKKYSPWTILTMSLLTFWALNVFVTLLSMQGQKALWFYQKCLNLCSDFWLNYPFKVASALSSMRPLCLITTMFPGAVRSQRPGTSEGLGESPAQWGWLHLPQPHHCDGGQQRHNCFHPDRQTSL